MTAPSDSRAPCPCCGERRFKATFVAHGYEYERCLTCGHQRMVKPPAPADLDAHYRAQRESGEAAWQEHPQNLIKFDAILARLERWVQPGRFLDVGCSLGTSLLAARNRGWEAVGVELSEPVVEFARDKFGVDIRDQRLEDCGFEPGSFDLIWMHHTLEHLDEPDVVLRLCRELLRDGGVMFQALPNHGSLKSRIFGSRWSYGVTNEHVSLFAKRTLELLVQRCGFRVLSCTTPSHREDPRFVYDVFHSIDRLDLLARLCARQAKRHAAAEHAQGNGRAARAEHGAPEASASAEGCAASGPAFDPDSYVRFLTENRVAHWFSNRFWPAWVVQRLGLGEELYLVATTRTGFQ